MSKLKKLGPEAEKYIMQLKGMGYSADDIAKEIERKYGVKVHRTTVNRFIKQRFMFSLSYARGEKEVVHRAAELLDMVKEDYLRIRNLLWEVVKKAKEIEDYEAVRRALMSLSSHLEKMQDTLGGITKTKYEKLDITKLSTQISSILKNLEEKGYIEIKKKLPDEYAG